jgi:hypothetical protein
MSIEVIDLALDAAHVWIATDNAASVNYSYGGTRLVDYQAEDFEVDQLLRQLMLYESALKNRLINRAIKRNLHATYKDKVPEGFMESAVGGARCLIRPKDEKTAAILNDPHHPQFREMIDPIFAGIGKELNKRDGKIKLTPDFGHFAGLSDILHEFTPHILGINRANGGCGGKTVYSSTGVIAALETMGVANDKDVPITLIGAAGAMGSDILAYFRREGFKDIAVCDLAYEHDSTRIPLDLLHLPSQAGMFTDACLERDGVIVATTIGHELENSCWQRIPGGTKLFLAHNLAIPTGQEGITLMRQIAGQGVLALPGQMLTLGGAFTSRLEWFWRQSKDGQLFDKPMAHSTIKEVVRFLVTEIIDLANDDKLVPYEAMLQYADMEC